MPLPTTLEAYAIRRIHKLEKQIDEKDAKIAELAGEKLATEMRLNLALEVIKSMNPHMSTGGDYVSVDFFKRKEEPEVAKLLELGITIEGYDEGEM